MTRPSSGVRGASNSRCGRRERVGPHALKKHKLVSARPQREVARVTSPFSVADSFEQQTFTGLSLTAEDLSGKHFFRCRFENCALPESRWKRALLEDCEFHQCDLTRANVAQLGLRGVKFTASKVMGVDFSGVSANPDVHFEECHLRYASFSKLSLRRAKFLRSQLREVNLYDCDLTDAEFSGSDLSGANVRGCTLTRTDFRRATAVFIDPSHNKVKETRIEMDAAAAIAEHLGFTL